MIADDLAKLAADAEPPALDDGAARRLIEGALSSPLGPIAVPRARPWFPLAIGALAAATIAIVLLRPVPAPGPELLHISLPTGDRLVGTNAQFDVARLDRTDRRLELHSGTLLVDVAHVANGQRFAITTAHLVATAKGTVFSVETDPQRSIVRVYEGIVEVTQGGEARLLPAGTVWSSETRMLAMAPVRPPVFAPEIDQAIRRREVVVVAPAPAPVPQSQPPPIDVVVTKPQPTPVTIEHEPDPTPKGPDLDALLARARAELAAGNLEQALATTQLAAKQGATFGAWHVVAADALRGLGRTREAADAYELAARELTGTDAFEAGYSAAYLWFKEQKDYDRALDALVISRADAADSPLEERGLALHAKILIAANRKAEAKPIALRYLARYPKGELRAIMESLLK